METQHMTQQTFSDLIGISPASLSSIFNGRTKPTLTTVDAIRKKFPTLNLEWILYGHGAMFKDTNFLSDTQTANSQDVVDEPSFNFDDDAHPLAQHSSDGVIQQDVNYTPKKIVKNEVKYLDKPKRTITEIRVFYDDLTYESFVPKK